MFMKLDIIDVEFQVELEILYIFCYFLKIYVELDINNIEFYLKICIELNFENIKFYIEFDQVPKHKYFC